MKRKTFIFGFSLLFLFSNTDAQILNENFDLTTGVLSSLSTDWTEGTTGSTDIQIVDGNLSYLNYPSSNIGRQIIINGGATGRSGVYTEFSDISVDGTTIYASFLLNMTSTSDMDINSSRGDYFCAFTTSTIKRSYLYVRQGSTSSKYNIGISKSSSSSLSWYLSELDVNSTYLIVIAYVFQSGDDESKLWINPDLSGSEHTADVIVSTGTDAILLNRFQFLQKPVSGDEIIDGVRIATDWSLAPLPVELTSFTAVSTNLATIVLNWTTATEVNNYGFEIERVTNLRGLSNLEGFETIGFVNGHGNSNSPKEYSFIDTDFFGSSVASAPLSYRIKQIDTDGGFEYSEVVSVRQSLAKTELFQNHPNPFNPSTQISFALAEAGRVNISVYNMLGQKVSELVNKNMEVGIQNIDFNGSNLSSGFYIYRLETTNYSKTMKMLLLK